ncbi:hypothetical protein DPEC_G00295820 [Dallia pectoralis]|uniref:Uncharacterized protein n=1 Tax=Dallia pectoralis TaxID=75939 RepID=A0ACC2FJ07_DALPE|nr:hypothetical protein DPEC_G00295820 [Dallia pectoralis]
MHLKKLSIGKPLEVVEKVKYLGHVIRDGLCDDDDVQQRNWPLRGKNAKLGDPKNGNFLGVLEVIARYDVTLAEHLRKVKASKYFAVELDCTPDISKQEQASVIIRYVHTDDKKNVTINESFVGFTVVKDTTGKGLTETLTGVLGNLGLELANLKRWDILKEFVDITLK